jgi:hypothetical protein
VTDVLAADETTLVARFRLGDPLAARTIIQRHNRMLWRLARGIVDDDTDAEEQLQNAYVRALTSISTLSRRVLAGMLFEDPHVLGPAKLCQWIEDGCFCNAPSVPGRSWCAEHLRRVFTTADGAQP